MQKHRTSRLFRLCELSPEQLVFKLTPEQLARAPQGQKLFFHKSRNPTKIRSFDWYMNEETRWFISSHPYGESDLAPWLAECMRSQWAPESEHGFMDMVWPSEMWQSLYPAYLRTCGALGMMG